MADAETTFEGLRAELFVADVERSKRFYVDVLGFTVLRTAPDGYVALGRQRAHLGLNPVAGLPSGHPVRPSPGERVGLGVELVLMVADVAAAHDLAMASGAGGVSALRRQSWGLTDFRLQDPDGYYVRVTGLSATP